MSHLLYSESVKIEAYLNINLSHRNIAYKLNRSNSTISDEIRKYSINGKYIASIAYLSKKTKRNIINCFNSKIKPGSYLENLIITHIKKYWSPEQIAGYFKFIGKDTIYKYIKYNKPELIKTYFRRKGKPYKYGTIKASYIYDRISIHNRPLSAYNKTEIGHWEGDTIWGKNRKGGIVTFTERVSGLEIAGILEEKNAINVTIKTKELFDRLPDKLKKSITLDNGREFVEHYIWRKIIGIDTYFADIGNAGQRGLNENTNGLLRQFFPKGTDLRTITQEELDYYVNLLNNRPRKRLGFLTPIQYLQKFNCAVLS